MKQDEDDMYPTAIVHTIKVSLIVQNIHWICNGADVCW